MRERKASYLRVYLKQAVCRLRRVLAAIITTLVLVVPASPTEAQPPAPDFPIAGGRFFQEANGQGGSGNTGYSVTNDQDAQFYTEFERLGGVTAIGYPVSRRFLLDGFVTQAFQKAVLQWRPDAGQAFFVNIMDRLHDAGYDQMLLVNQISPLQLDLSAQEAGLSFDQIVRERQAFLADNPAIQSFYFSVDNPLLRFGLPTSRVEDFGPVLAIRLQRTVLQQWKVDVPWASAGQVVVANGGDLAKELDFYPSDAIQTEVAPPPLPTAADETIVGAGDIADCSSYGDQATANLLDGIGGTVIALGDNAYPSGSAAQYANCYDPTWGRFKARTRPVPGNHEYLTPGASAYYNYFGAAAGDPAKGYYSYNLGAWHIVALNTNCGDIGGCNAGSPEERWLRADLAANPAPCTLALGHEPRFSSGPHGDGTEMQDFWKDLYVAGVDLVLAGHDHDYERFAAQDPFGNADPARGIQEFVVGTGGGPLYMLGNRHANSVVSNDTTFGVLKLTLHPTGYDWQFIPESGKTFTDSGSASCH